jgi:hypothetical protein
VSRRRWNLWATLRHDIGRKVTALALALLMWAWLENFVVGEKDFTLEVTVMSTQRLADDAGRKSSGVYLVVPDDLIVIEKEASVRLKVRGLKDDIENLVLSAVLIYDGADLGDADEAVVSRLLERSTFRSPGENPDLTEFRIRPDDVFDVTLARRETLENVTLSAANVAIEGRPRDSYVFRSGGIRVTPNTVTITGPRGALKTMETDPTLPRLAPVDLEGKTSTVTKSVGLSKELLAQGVILLPGMVAVTVPIEPEGMSVNLLGVQVHYDNEEALSESGRRVVNKTDTLDLKLVGPSSVLTQLTTDQLGRMFQLRLDWGDIPANLPLGRADVTILRSTLPFEVSVSLLDSGDAPFIEYELGDIEP